MTAIPLWVRRPAGERVGWLRTVDHKEIGVLYIGMGVAFFALGGLEALLIRRALRKRRNRSELVTTKRLEPAIAALATIGFRRPETASGIAATL